VHDDDPVRSSDLPAVLCDKRGQSRIAGDLPIQQQGIEFLCIEIVQGDLVAGLAE
jgi:hypothetical protein